MAEDHGLMPEEMTGATSVQTAPKSLMRFKSVHKSWSILISSPEFVTKHFSVLKNNKFSSPTITILLKRYVLADINTGERKAILSLFNPFQDNDDGDPYIDPAMENLHVPPSMRLKRMDELNEELEVSGHCDGIICLSDFGETIVLCNLVIRDFKLLPTSNLLSSLEYRDDYVPEGFSTALTIGFGYDSRSSSYKVVRIINYGCNYKDAYVTNEPPRAEVYSVVTNSWKEASIGDIVRQNVKNKMLSFGQIIGLKAAESICCKGVIYWPGTERLKDYSADTDDPDELWEAIVERIIMFHLDDETFRIISSPGVVTF